MNPNHTQLRKLMDRYPDAFHREVIIPGGYWFLLDDDDLGWFSQFEYRLIPRGPLPDNGVATHEIMNRAIYLGMGPLEFPEHIRPRFSGFLLDDDDMFHDISVDTTGMQLSGQIDNYHYWIDVNDPNVDDIVEHLGYTVNRKEEFDLGEAANTVISLRVVTEEEQQLQMKLDAVCRHRDKLEKNRDLQVELNEELREQNESLQEELEGLQEELEEALNYISDLEDDNADIDVELGEVQNEVEELEGRCDDLEDENANLQDYLEESESRIAEMEELVHNQTSTLKQKGWIDPVEAMIISRKIDNLYNTINRL